MASTAPAEGYRAPVRVVPAATDAGYVDWGAILAGTVVAVALSFVLLTFGSAVGLSVVSFEPGEGASLKLLGIASGLWFVWVAVTSFGAGGYIAGRLRRPVADCTPDEVEARDGAHGLVVWGLGALLGAVLAASGITGVVGAAGKAAGTVAETATEAVGGDVGYLGDRLMGGDGGAATAVLVRNLADGDVSAEDRAYLVNLVAQRTGQSPDQVGAAVDKAVTDAKAAYAKAVQAGEQARVATAIAAFVIAATLMASAAVAFLTAAAGGDHRDRAVPWSTFGR